MCHAVLSDRVLTPDAPGLLTDSFALSMRLNTGVAMTAMSVAPM